MLFNSYGFIFVFLPISLCIFFLFSRFKLTKAATAALVLASLIFYSYWNVKHLPLILLSIIINYGIGKQVEKKRPGRGAGLYLALGITVDLLLLGYFKYANFLIDSINFAAHTDFQIGKIVLPLGISFYTFTQIGYLVDAYRGETRNYGFLTYCLFVTFFPHLIAGPILYHRDIIPQFHRPGFFVFSYENFCKGVAFFTLGLFKKVVVADSLIAWVDPVFKNAYKVTFFDSWAGALAYTMQLYFDFSGYSDMAVGLGLMLNTALPVNFNSPYKSSSIIDFWRRWHITLSNFLKLYLYIPLGGNRKGYPRKMLNLFVTMLLGGLWHGAGWTFVLWGGLHGAYLVVNHTWRRLDFKLPPALSRPLTFLAVVAAWVVFRANSVHDAFAVLKAMAGLNAFVLPAKYQPFLSPLAGGGLKFQDSM
ncbi:MAG: MBOAT family protein, partial [Firmicutes bacterium]|nr:MBOAT family protein [Bacillota bacterium]